MLKIFFLHSRKLIYVWLQEKIFKLLGDSNMTELMYLNIFHADFQQFFKNAYFQSDCQPFAVETNLDEQNRTQ